LIFIQITYEAFVDIINNILKNTDEYKQNKIDFKGFKAKLSVLFFKKFKTDKNINNFDVKVLKNDVNQTNAIEFINNIFPHININKSIDNKSIDNKSIDNKSIDNKSIDNKSIDNKSIDNKSIDNNFHP
jgi:hypothetical protein